jgi:hypothetical protein
MDEATGRGPVNPVDEAIGRGPLRFVDQTFEVER